MYQSRTTGTKAEKSPERQKDAFRRIQHVCRHFMTPSHSQFSFHLHDFKGDCCITRFGSLAYAFLLEGNAYGCLRTEHDEQGNIVVPDKKTTS